MEVAEESLLLFDFRALEHHGTTGEAWNFWWFEFRPVEPVRLPMLAVMRAPILGNEPARLRAVFDSLHSENLADRCAANAGLQSLLHEWWSVAGGIGETVEPRGHAAVEPLINAMHRHPERAWTLVEMARLAGMSISSLRAAFQKTTGESPARVRNSLRLAHAFERLRTGTRTVAEVADEMGFCDPFHFSKAFRREFGFPPSAMRRREGKT